MHRSVEPFTSFIIHRVFYLVALRHTLTTLKLHGNKSVTDDALPALLLLSRLRKLGLRGTTISMTGLRRLITFSDRLSLAVPADCEAYIDSEPRIPFALSLRSRPEKRYTLNTSSSLSRL